jgi:hypothetical protein
MQEGDWCMYRVGCGKVKNSWILLERRKSFPILYLRLTVCQKEGREIQTQICGGDQHTPNLTARKEKNNKDEAA